MGLGIGAAISGISGLAGGMMQSDAAAKAGRYQAIAAQTAAAEQMMAVNAGLTTQQQFFAQGKAALDPYINAGQGTLSQLTSQLPTLTAQFNPTIAQLEQTPGYQFTLDQGEKAVQNSYAGRGLASSGAAMKGAADYASGLAANTYQQQFQNYWTGNQNAFNMLLQPSQLGAQGAGALASMAGGSGMSALSALTNAGQGIAGSLQNVGNAQAAGTLGSANALAGGIAGVGNAFNQYSMLNSLLGGGGGGGFGGINNLLTGNIGNMPATGVGSPGDYTSNLYALTQGINPFG